jgi:hypothetical protein
MLIGRTGQCAEESGEHARALAMASSSFSLMIAWVSNSVSEQIRQVTNISNSQETHLALPKCEVAADEKAEV